MYSTYTVCLCIYMVNESLCFRDHILSGWHTTQRGAMHTCHLADGDGGDRDAAECAAEVGAAPEKPPLAPAPVPLLRGPLLLLDRSSFSPLPARVLRPNIPFLKAPGFS